MGIIVRRQELKYYNDENQEVGSADLYRTDDGMYYLSNFNIYPEYRDRGYGQKFLRELIDNYNVTTLDVDNNNAKAIHIYKKLGFKPTGNSVVEMRI